MPPEVFLFLLIGFFASIIGAVPFGLVNLSVLQTAINKGTRATMPISYGASLIEVIYGIFGIFAGSLLYRYIDKNPWFNIFTAAVLMIMGLVFFFSRSQFQMNKNNTFGGFVYGILLNLLSLQVLAYWILAISVISSLNQQLFTPLAIILFLAGIWAGKMSVLISYASLGNKIASQSQKISKNINRFIGIILIGIALFTIIRFYL
ncbi:MAG: LysE family transporter [Bacteroidales bacterium]|nr:LysE family transporter [Bacteroidales bacterium]